MLARDSPIRAFRVVSLTVTEKGYCHDPATGRINFLHPEIAHDLAHPESPASTIGVLTAGLAARRAAGAGAINIVCCDNLPHNGRTVEGIVTAYAQAVDPSLAEWIGAHVAFPCTMVDRIVPATTDADVAEASRRLGVTDAAPVVAEPYTSWVIENRFAGCAPALGGSGCHDRRRRRAVRDDEASPPERQPFDACLPRLSRRIRFHLAGIQRSAARDSDRAADGRRGDAHARGTARRRARCLWRADSRTLPQSCAAAPHPPDRHGRIAEAAAAAPRHRARRGSMAAARSRISRSRSPGGFATQAGTDDEGKPIVVADPMAAKFAAIAAAAGGNAAQIADGFLDLVEVFGADLSANATFRRAVSRDVGGLLRDGVRRTLAVHIAQPRS